MSNLELTPIQALGIALSTSPDTEHRTMEECIDLAAPMLTHLKRMGYYLVGGKTEEMPA